MVATLNKPPTVDEYERAKPPTVAEYERSEPLGAQGAWPPLPVDSSRFIAPMPERGRGRISKPGTTFRQEEKAKRPRWDEFVDATARGIARVGAAGYQAGALMEELPPMTAPGMKPAEPITLKEKQLRKQAAMKLRKNADFLWKLSQHPEVAARNKDIASKALNLIGETIPYITATTAAYVAAGPLGGFTVGSMVEGNSAYRTALDYGVPEVKAKKIGVGVGVISGAIEAFGGRYAEKLLRSAANKLKSKILKVGAIFGIGTVVEALEEGGQEIAAITGEETYRDVNWNERATRTLGAMAGGGFLGGAMRGGGMAARGIVPEIPPTAPIVAPSKPVAPITKPKVPTVVEYEAIAKPEAVGVAPEGKAEIEEIIRKGPKHSVEVWQELKKRYSADQLTKAYESWKNSSDNIVGLGDVEFEVPVGPGKKAPIKYTGSEAEAHRVEVFIRSLLAEEPTSLKHIAQPVAKAEPTKVVGKKAEVETPTEVVKQHRVDILPHKAELLKEIDAAIEKAPEKADGTSVHFEINGGANIYNEKKALQTFRDKVKAMKPTEIIPVVPKKIKIGSVGMALKPGKRAKVTLPTTEQYADDLFASLEKKIAEKKNKGSLASDIRALEGSIPQDEWQILDRELDEVYYKWSGEEYLKTVQLYRSVNKRRLDKSKLKAEQVKPKQFLDHIDDPKMPAGFAAVPIPKSVQESARRAGLKVKRTAENIREDIDKFKFYPNAPPEFRNAVRTDMIGALTKATKNIYEDAREAIWGGLNKRDVQKSVEILYARDQLSRTKLGKGNPEISLEQSQEILNKTLKNASPEAIAAADRFKAIHDKYTNKLVERGILDKGQRIENHVRHYVEDYTPEWAPFANIPTRLKRPFRGYAKKAVGTTKEYRQDQESLLASLMEMEHHNLIEDFVETQVKKYDIKPKLSKKIRGKLFGTDARGYAKVPRPGRIYIHEGKRYRAYTPDIPFSRAIYMTENGEAALGSFKNVALIPEDMYNLFRDFSQRGSRAVYLLNRATGYWKTMAILSHFPSFNVNNMVGDTWVAMAQHPKPLSLLSEYDTSIRYLTGRLEPKYKKQLDDFITKHDIKQTFAQAELAIGRKAKNPIAWLLRKSYRISDFRESINRVAYASSLLKANQRGEGAKMVEAHDWIDTDGLSTEDALGKIAREVLVDYQAQSKTFRRFVRGGIAPFGTWYFKMSKTMWKWFSKHPFKATAMFITLPLAALGYNRRRKEIQELEQQLPDYIRNRTHFILGEQPDGTIRVLSLQIPQDVLIGTKIFSITVDYANRVIAGEMTPKQAAIETMKRWGISEYEGAKYLLTPWLRMYSGLKTGKDPYDKAPVYRRDYNKMTWDEKAKDISAYILKTSVPFLGYTIQTYEKGLPQDVAFKKIMNSLAGKGALGIYDVNKKGQVQFDVKGKKMTFEWEDIHRIHKLTAKEYKYLGQLEDAFVASEQSPREFLVSQKAKSSLLKIYDVWAKRVPDLKKVTDQDARIRIVATSLGERLTNRVTKPRILSKWYQVKMSRAKTAVEKRQISQEYAKVKKQRLIEVYKALPKTAREIEMVRKIKSMD